MMLRNKIMLGLMASAMVSHTPLRKTEKQKKPCLHCKTPHSHNNRWCSAECKKAYDLEQTA
jgi:hypothetical protein